ncbi:hypothetical protein K443DRAFT_105709, partial [Laccaria amethystina LaAM-08-1]
VTISTPLSQQPFHIDVRLPLTRRPTDDFPWVPIVLSRAARLPTPFLPFCRILIVMQWRQ